MARHGGKVLADQLALRGVRRVFSVPGESFLAALDGLFDSGIANVVCRQEGGAAMMAEAYGKLTGQPGVAFVTRGPGATNASAGLHIARQDSTPMVLFVGQIDTAHRDREAFQEVDYRAFFGPLVKWVAEVDQTDRLPEYIHRAFDVALSGRPGPVVLALPENMLSALTDVPDPVTPTTVLAAGLEGVAAEALGWLAGAERPLVVVGGPHWSAEAGADLARFAATQACPWHLASGDRITSTTAIPAMRAISTSGSIRRWPPGCGRRTDSSSSGRGSAISRRRAIASSIHRPRPSGSFTSTRMRTRPGMSGGRMPR
jgi:acetolactate synthase I/II/III large subunit